MKNTNIIIRHLPLCLFLFLCSMNVVLAQERLNEFVVEVDETHNPMAIYANYGATPNDGVVIINSTIPDLEFGIMSVAKERLRKVVPDKRKNRYLLIVQPNDNNYKQYTITINAKGFMQGKINDIEVKAGLSSGFIVNTKYEITRYSIGDDAKDFIGIGGYRIAYLDASGKHGFAIQLVGKTISEGWSPTLNELKLMYQYRHLLGLEGEYWSSDETHELTSDVYTFDFSTGKTHKRHSGGGFYMKRNCMSIERF